MTNYAKQLTKEYLMSLGITEITEDGEHIFKGDKEVTQHTHKDGYKRVTLYDKELHQMLYPLTKCSSCGQLVFGVHRIVYAWFHGIANSELVIDHIDNNKANNNINNLQELTPTQNICKNKVINQNLRPCNMHKSRKFYEDKLNELLAKYEAAKQLKDGKLVHTLRNKLAYCRDNIRYWDANSDKYYRFLEIDNIKNEIKSTKAVINHYKELLEQIKREWHEAEGIHKINAKYNIELCELDIKATKDTLKKLRKQLEELNNKGE